MKRKNEVRDDSYSGESSSSEDSEQAYYSDAEIDYSSEVIIIMNPLPDQKQKKKVKINKKKQAILDEIKNLNKEKKMPIEDKIIFSKFSLEQKAKLLDDFEKKTPSDNKYSNYLEKVLKIPVGEYKNIHMGNVGEFMLNLRENLDHSIYGHKETKEEIIDFMSAKLANPDGLGLNILALQSEPGFGKTRFIRALGKTLGLPFQQISFGGMNDTSILAGHDYTYVGSKPGKIYETLVKSKCMNPIIYLDECFPYDQKVVTIYGDINIGKLYENFISGKETPLLKTFNVNKQIFEFKKITSAWEKNNDSLIELNFGNFKTNCTENHLFLAERGWIKAKDIEHNDKIICQPSRSTTKKINDDQYQILLGSFLGDGHVYKLKSGKIGLLVRHGIKQEEYCKWKAFMFNVKQRYTEKNGYAQTRAVYFDTKVLDIEEDFPDTKTTCPQWLIDKLDWKGIAIWFMDDGSISQKQGYSSCTISTDSFDEDSQKRLVKKLNSYGVECSYKYYKKDYYQIRLTSCGYKNLLVGISKYIHPNLYYKINPPDIIERKLLTEEIYWSFSEIKNLKQNETYKVWNSNSGKIADYKYRFCKKCKKNMFCRPSGCSHLDSKEDLLFKIRNECMYSWDNTTYNYEILHLTSKKYVKNLSRFPCHDGKVYDIEVEDNHNFLITSSSTSKNKVGVVVHNCDKMGELGSQKTIEMNGLLTHLLDKEQNMEFYDHYLGDIPLDLSRVFFIVSFNNEHNVDPVVLNRLKVIKIKESSYKEKIEIVKRFTIPEIYKNLNIEKDKISISEDVVKYIILSKTIYEKGMRNINKNFYTLYGKLNTLICLKNISSDVRQKITKDFAYEKVTIEQGKIDITIDLVDKLLYNSKSNEAYMAMYS